jgi:hypothetical protein
MMTESMDPATVIQRQLDAFNTRDVDAILAIYSDEAKMFEHPATLIASGSTALRERFTARFSEPNLHAVLLDRVVMGNIVVDHERVKRNFPEGAGSIELMMIYEIQHGRIANAWSITGVKTLEL